MSRQRFTAMRALEILQNLPSDCSDDDDSDIQIDATVNAAIASVQQAGESESSDSSEDKSDLPSQAAHPLANRGTGLVQGRDGSRWQKLLYHLLLRAAYNLIIFFDLDMGQHLMQPVR